MNPIEAIQEGPPLRSWKLLIAFAAVYLLGAVAFSAMVLLSVDESQGHAGGFAAAVAVAFAGVALVAFLVALAFAWLLRRGTAKPVVALVLVLAGWVPYYASGYFEGFLPVFAGSLIVGLLAVFEALA
ncbi:MAG: hypothetical protein ACLFM8_08685 [Halobacteriales archaeon]